MQHEEWRLVLSLPAYEASSLGRMRRVPFTGAMPHGGFRTYGGKEWFGAWSKVDERFQITYRGHSYKVARLICEAFHGPPPFPGAVCMHLDEDSRNNRADNLAWGTQRENMNAPKFKAWQRTRTGENSTHAKARRSN